MAVNSTLIKTAFNFLKSEKSKVTKTKKIRQIACSHNDRPSRTNCMVITGSFNYALLHVYCMHDFSLVIFYRPKKQHIAFPLPLLMASFPIGALILP